MSTGLLVMLIGLFGIPSLLLWAGHHLRRKSRRVRGAFWGGLAGHTAAALIAVFYSMVPPEAWTAADTLRGFAGFYLMVLGAAIGALLGIMLAARSHPNR
ncbi:MAG: hypothetical protein H0U13_10120 [Gemmatimonadaceae bacterium]|nr:hypothetical protein [Gemmatimonadaceae bacterium]